MPIVYIMVVLGVVLSASCSTDSAQPPEPSQDSAPAPEHDAGTGAGQAPRAKPPFTVEIDQHGLFDLELHKVKLHKRFESDAPGPRWIAHGRMRNDSPYWIYRGDVMGGLTICFKTALKDDGADQTPALFDANGCLRQASFQRGFELPISGSAPWRPGTWRHFTLVAGPLNPVFREMEPDRVSADIALHARSSLGHAWEASLWQQEPAWVQLRGYPIMQAFTLPEATQVANWSLQRGDEVFVEGVAGRKVAVLYKNRRYWTSQYMFPSMGALESTRADPTPLPVRAERDVIIVEVLEFTTTHVRREHKGKRDVRYVVVSLAITGLGDRPVRLSRSDFQIIMGDQSTAQPITVNNITPHPLSLEALSLNERQTGELAFEWPYGVAPMALVIALPEERLVVIPPRELR